MYRSLFKFRLKIIVMSYDTLCVLKLLYSITLIHLLHVVFSKNYLLGRKETSEMADRNKEALLEVKHTSCYKLYLTSYFIILILNFIVLWLKWLKM